MPKYNRGQVQEFAKAAGLNDNDAKTASYIAMAESSGNTDATNHYVEQGVTYYVDGLWQISTIHGLGSRESMKDPMTNARAMVKLRQDSIASGHDPWRPWESSKFIWGSAVNLQGSGAIGSTGSQAVTADNIPGVSQVVDAASATGDALANIGKGIGKTGAWIGNPHNWLRVAYVILGGGVVIAGLAKLIGYDAGLSPVGAMAKMGKTTKTPATPAEPKLAAEPKPIVPGAASSLPRHHPARTKDDNNE